MLAQTGPTSEKMKPGGLYLSKPSIIKLPWVLHILLAYPKIQFPKRIGVSGPGDANVPAHRKRISGTGTDETEGEGAVH